MSIRKNFLYNVIYQVFMIFLPIITVPYVSRVLGADGIGIYSYTAAYAQYFVLLGMIGISLYGNRQIAYTKSNKEKMSKEFCNIYGLQFITTTISTIIYIIIFVIINKNNRMIYFAQSLILLSTIFDISWFFIGYEDMKSVVTRNSIVKILGIGLIFLLVKSPSDVILYCVIMSGCNLLGQLIMWLNLKGRIIYYKPIISESIKHLKPAAALFISQLAIQVYVLLDKTMLGAMTNLDQVGLYENSQKTIKLVLTIVTSLGVVMLPRMSALYSEGKIKELKELIYKAFRFINFMAFPLSLGLMSISNGFSVWFYGESFNGIQLLLKIGSLIIIAISWSNILGIQVMLPMKKEKQFTISVTIGAAVNLILNLILIQKLGAIGTTISSVFAEISVTVVQLIVLKEFISLKKILKTAYKPFVSAVIMLICVYLIGLYIPVGIIYTMLQVAIGAVIYLGIMFMFKDEFLKEGLNLIKERILKR